MKEEEKRARKPFFISFEHPNKEIEEITEEVFRKFEKIGSVNIPRAYVGSYWKEGEYGSVEWYVKQAYNPQRRQVSVDTLWELLEKEPWQQEHPHYELMILTHDLYMETDFFVTDFVFGETIPQIYYGGEILLENTVSGSILSIYRPKERYGENWKKALKAMLFHELGHFFGLPSYSNPNFIYEGSIFGKAKSVLDYNHCNDRNCIMEQVNTPGRLDLLQKVMYLELHNPDYFCEYDLKALRQNLQALFL